MNRQLVALVISLLAAVDALAAQPLIGVRVPPLGDQLTRLQGDPPLSLFLEKEGVRISRTVAEPVHGRVLEARAEGGEP